jgi:hypothetical protein
MRLCLALGCTLDELGHRMSAREFGLWMTLYRQEPFGDQRADLRSAIVAATVANYAGKQRAEHAGVAQPAEFMWYADAGREQPAAREEPDPVAFFSALGR